jgi:uncharacterized protein YfiM (DUF2279 family)
MTRRGLHPVSAVVIATLVSGPAIVRAEDRWFARDKAEHFGATAGFGAGGYALASTVADRERWRIAAGVGSGIGAAAAKELWDRSHGDASWRDFAWGAVGTAAGVTIAWAIDRLRHREKHDTRLRKAQPLRYDTPVPFARDFAAGSVPVAQDFSPAP